MHPDFKVNLLTFNRNNQIQESKQIIVTCIEPQLEATINVLATCQQWKLCRFKSHDRRQLTRRVTTDKQGNLAKRKRRCDLETINALMHQNKRSANAHESSKCDEAAI